MQDYTEMVAPLIGMFEQGYKEVVPDDYFSQRIRGSEIVSCDVQHYGNLDG